MFYSEDILKSKKHGVATVWLMATLGPRSMTTKNLTRKTIDSVNIKKAVETVINPVAPLALRLQGNLLYGTTRVFAQQCDYTLADARTVQHAMRMLVKLMKTSPLDARAGKVARPEQLLLMDDPFFVAEMPLPSLNFDFASLMEASQQSDISSPHSASRRGPNGSHPGSAAINLPELNLGTQSSHSSMVSNGLPFEPSHLSSAQKLVTPEVGRLYENADELLFDDLPDFDIGEDGQIRDLEPEEIAARRASSVMPGHGGPSSDSKACGKVLREHRDALAGFPPIVDDDYFVFRMDDDDQVLPDAEPFPTMGARQKNLQLGREDSEAEIREESSESAEAPMKVQRKSRPLKTLQVDTEIQLKNSELKLHQDSYCERMAQITKDRKIKELAKQAKKNAYSFVWGNGLGGVGKVVGSNSLPGPLSMFAGGNLRALITGISYEMPHASPKGSSKRKSSNAELIEEENPNAGKRPQAPFEDDYQLSHGHEDDGIIRNFYDSDPPLEVGRDAAAALEDHHSSAMPWNVSASVNSHRTGSLIGRDRGMGSVIARPGSALSSGIQLPGSRFTSASPLLGRGRLLSDSNLPPIELLDDDILLELHSDGFDNSGLGSNGTTQILGSGLGHVSQGADSQQKLAFELYGPAAAVDTQTAANSQWISDAMAQESRNFLRFVRNTVSEAQLDEVVDDELLDGSVNKTTFETLIPPRESSKMVASQAFLHLLNLASMSMLGVSQVWEDVHTDEGTIIPTPQDIIILVPYLENAEDPYMAVGSDDGDDGNPDIDDGIELPAIGDTSIEIVDLTNQLDLSDDEEEAVSLLLNSENLPASELAEAALRMMESDNIEREEDSYEDIDEDDDLDELA